MRTTLAAVGVTLAVLCLSLAPCVPARPHSSLSTNSNHVVTAKQVGEVTTPTDQDWLSPVNRRSLKSSGSKSKPSKPSKKKKSKIKVKGGKATLLGSVIGVSVFVVVFLFCVVFIIVTEKRKEDPKWRVRSFMRRKLKRKYTVKGRKAAAKENDLEKPHVEKGLPEATGDLDTGLAMKVDSAEDHAPVKSVEPPDVK